MRRYRGSVVLAISAAALLGMAITGTAGAAPVTQNTMVIEDPAGFTPRVVTGTAIYKLLQVGSTMFAGGDFTQVRNATGQATSARTNLFSFNATTGAAHLTVGDPRRPGLAMATDGTSLWVGGEFHQVNGVSRPRLVKVNPTTGAVDTAFNAGLDGAVEDAQFVNGRLIVGGKFTGALRAVDPVTGADTGYLNLGVTGTVDPGAGPTDIYRVRRRPGQNPAGRHRQLHHRRDRHPLPRLHGRPRRHRGHLGVVVLHPSCPSVPLDLAARAAARRGLLTRRQLLRDRGHRLHTARGRPGR